MSENQRKREIAIEKFLSAYGGSEIIEARRKARERIVARAEANKYTRFDILDFED